MSRRDETFILYYWEDFEEYETENPSCYYCLSESTVQILLSALRFAGWRTRWRLDRNDHSRRMESNYIWNKIDYMAALAHKEITTDMSCDLQAGFQSLADAILAAAEIQAASNKGCNVTVTNNCGDTSVATASTPTGLVNTIPHPTTGEPVPVFGTQPSLGIPSGEFPEGFDDEAQYLLDKCALANLIIDGLIASLRNLGALGVFNYVALAGLIVLAVTGAIVFPPAFIPIAAVVLGGLAGVIGLLALAADEISDNREEWVCALYEGDNVESIIAVVSDLIDGVVAAIGATGAAGVAVTQIILLLVNSDTLNQLFTKTAHLNYPDADCTGCLTAWRVYTSPTEYDSGSNFEDLYGQPISAYQDGSWPLSPPNEPFYIAQFGFAGTPTINLTISGRTGHSYLTDFNLYSDIDFSFSNRTYFSDTDPGSPYAYGCYYIVSSTPFTVTIEPVE